MNKILICTLLLIMPVFAEEIYTVIIKKHEEKVQTRWTLGDWLATKQRISLMDQWLALNTESNIFEMALSYNRFNFKNSTNQKSYSDDSINAKLYITFLGIEGTKQTSEYFSDIEKLSFNLRILGGSQQSTHVNLKYGQLSYQSFSPKFFEVDTELYLISMLGLSFSYLNTDKENIDSNSFSFRQRKYGAFLELWFLRFFYEKSNDDFFDNGAKNSQDGERVGISLYF